jgi:hypothetical protein
MVMQIRADTGAVDVHRNPELHQVASRADARSEKDHRRAVDTGTQDESPRANLPLTVGAATDERARAIAVEHEPIGHEVVDDADPFANGIEKRERRVPPNSVGDVLDERSDPRRTRCVVAVGEAWDTGVDRRAKKCVLPRREILVTADESG